LLVVLVNDVPNTNYSLNRYLALLKFW